MLLVDVDGVISLWGFPSNRRPDGVLTSVDGIPHFLSSAAAAHLHALAEDFDLAWCTGWDEKANEVLPRVLGVPGPLPTITFPDAQTPQSHWKLGGIDAFAGPDRPLAWIDDGHDDSCRDWARKRPGPTHLEGTDPATGLTHEHVRSLTGFARELHAA